MSLSTHSKFYYGFEVSGENNYLDFSEGGPEISAVVDVGSYTPTQFAARIQAAMREAGTQNYVVSFDRDTRKITISAPLNFELLISSGSHTGTSVYSTAGFAGADETGTNSYLAGAAIATVYTTQFILQSYIAPEDNEGATYGTVNKSASGNIEVVTFGDEAFTEFEISYVNDRDNGPDAPIRYNPNGISELRQLMRHFISKAPFEFMPDEDDTNDFVSMFLESSPEDPNGLKYKLKEQYGRGLPGYFNTGVLKFRMLED